jgi:hypothetical protein
LRPLALPFGITTATDTTGTNENVQRVDLVGDPFAGVSHKIVTANGFKYVQWVNPAAFALPAPGTYGTMGRNQIYGPGYGDVDLSVFKNFKIIERFIVQFRTEIYNLFNRANLAPPNTFCCLRRAERTKWIRTVIRHHWRFQRRLPASVLVSHLTFSLL